MSASTRSAPRAAACCDGVEDDRRGVGAVGAPDDPRPGSAPPTARAARPPRPGRCRPRRARRAPPARVSLRGELADRRRLADAVHADEEPDGRRFRGPAERAVLAGEEPAAISAQCLEQRIGRSATSPARTCARSASSRRPAVGSPTSARISASSSSSKAASSTRPRVRIPTSGEPNRSRARPSRSRRARRPRLGGLFPRGSARPARLPRAQLPRARVGRMISAPGRAPGSGGGTGDPWRSARGREAAPDRDDGAGAQEREQQDDDDDEHDGHGTSTPLRTFSLTTLDAPPGCIEMP